MKLMEQSARGFALRTLVATGVICAGVLATLRYAGADPGGRTRDALSFAGTLRMGGRGAPTTELVFRFRKAGAAPCEGRATVTPDAATGAFVAEIPLGACPAFFDGSDVEFDVLAGSATVATAQRVNPVPYARYADQVGTTDCPVGYTRDGTAAAITLCMRSVVLGATTVRDEVVKVGTGPSAFWVDRYEASAWGADGVQRGASAADYGPNLLNNGQWASGAHDTLKAYSHAGVTPSRFVTWFQAAALCRASGKRMLNRVEWFAAADGLTAIDPTTSVDGNVAGEARCNTGGSSARPTGRGTGCESSWGVQDMIGNVGEWTDEWYAGAGTATGFINTAVQNWPAGYGRDGIWNVNGFADTGGGTAAGGGTITGVPSATSRGGAFGDQILSGVFDMNLTVAPSYGSASTGLRCMIPR